MQSGCPQTVEWNHAQGDVYATKARGVLGQAGAAARVSPLTFFPGHLPARCLHHIIQGVLAPAVFPHELAWLSPVI